MVEFFKNNYLRFSKMFRTLLLCLCLSSIVSTPALAATTIECKVKGVGIRYFKLEGFFTKKVLVRKSNQEWKEWCPTNEKQTFRMGDNEAFCQVAKHRHRGKLIWGDTIVNFDKPSWGMRYRFAKLGQAYVDSQPNGRESATCQFR